MNTGYPKLRAVRASLIDHEGNPYIVLSDPLGLAKGQVAVPQALAPLLGLCDGSRDLSALRIGFELHAGVSLSSAMVDKVMAYLDETLFLENDRFYLAFESAVNEFRSAPCRPPALAGAGYPADPAQLSEVLRRYVDAVPLEDRSAGEAFATLRGLVSPHIDFHRGGPVYAQAWGRAAASIADIDLAIIFGTDHFGGRNLFTLTRQNYATPWGTLNTDNDLVERLAGAIGGETAFEDELHHRHEHSIELALIWLHYFLGDRKCKLVPILCGSFEPLMQGGSSSPAQNAEIAAAIDILRTASKTRRTLVIAAADLAHMGPAFGDDHPIDAAGRARVAAADQGLIEAMCAADAEGFFARIRQERDERRICGLAPIYLTLRLLEACRGACVGYAQCPADEENASLVSICGVALA